jgi:hypothetical protein
MLKFVLDIDWAWAIIGGAILEIVMSWLPD